MRDFPPAGICVMGKKSPTEVALGDGSEESLRRFARVVSTPLVTTTSLTRRSLAADPDSHMHTHTRRLCQVHYPGRENRSCGNPWRTNRSYRAELPIVIAFPGTNFNVTYILRAMCVPMFVTCYSLACVLVRWSVKFHKMVNFLIALYFIRSTILLKFKNITTFI